MHNSTTDLIEALLIIKKQDLRMIPTPKANRISGLGVGIILKETKNNEMKQNWFGL